MRFKIKVGKVSKSSKNHFNLSFKTLSLKSSFLVDSNNDVSNNSQKSDTPAIVIFKIYKKCSPAAAGSAYIIKYHHRINHYFKWQGIVGSTRAQILVTKISLHGGPIACVAPMLWCWFITQPRSVMLSRATTFATRCPIAPWAPVSMHWN